MFGVIYLNRLVIKKYLKYFISFFIVFFLTFIIAYVNSTFDCDDIWLFGFTSNLSNGLMIYRDFNVVTTPLYYFIGVIFLNLFGNSLIYFDVFNALIITFIVFLAFCQRIIHRFSMRTMGTTTSSRVLSAKHSSKKARPSLRAVSAVARIRSMRARP